MSFINNQIKAFIFDMDGVLTDTVEYHFQSWQQLADELTIFFQKRL
ncbi:MAG: beta-phosphoglucomutase [Massilibacillus sp.]|jgi:beta-phosphoglucomutase-like phosphatase (HAD superfamily)|nr:beta-phosphoglucomutase [Massilibacillus sp.]